MIGKENTIFKIKKNYIKAIEIDKKFKRKFKKLKKNICEKSKDKERDFQCIFKECDKIFPNYTRWMLHYKMHVKNFFSFKVFLK